MSSIKDILVPDIGEFDAVEVIEVLVKSGDAVSVEDPLLTMESDKASMDVPSPFSGTVKTVKIKAGDKVSQNDLILTLVVKELETAVTETSAETENSEATAPETKDIVSTRKSESTSSGAVSKEPARRPPPIVMSVNQKSFLRAHASPSIRKFARELGVDLSQVHGSGRKERITKEDVQEFVKQALGGTASGTAAAGSGIPAMPEIDFSKFGPVEIKPLSRIQKKAAVNLHRGWLNLPIVTHHDEADITELEYFRKSLKDEAAKQGVKVTPLVFLLKACAVAIRKHPNFNSSLTADKENLVLKKYLHIGVAVDTPDGLVVPVIRDVEQKGLLELAKELGEVSEKARAKKLKTNDIQGGCFSISSLGGIGGTAFTPLVNAPEVAILGVTRSRMMPVWNGKEFLPRLMLPMDLTYDHRVIDGAQAARFMVDLCEILSDMRRMSL
ncbi:MAG TPA: dihydrolipoyllysine-residue acetyltransferase [Candidatus Lambdaproteobacteria bacterium]|uniref:Acetyltransferase component of pyruvate dehydrogenase complex n=1 Tax=SAR324 cluster bacterium TaxID=2024889 RepID=A0A432GCS6_9DELT|nr:dihydrolipoyllysine-residue acetyltransferase [SAR324 cluster bacterium]HIA34955.1 dihydrolipoyllysine-residue acetyltransferase [Candidatus Lambdaproteobacteria bacterium]HIM44214.1 dihydrolipoyllysine-residue acetyltransferase [Deltaproteobacteria bacterium]RTZ81041.1 MAG: dihydrolipoyllysine-residue acetyltransferase [SAR324 cluster bacterium]RTZ92594.1 MAG: dihydrolipoyllysine-residue acetyltransferase [SAR324 cluster bacterium]